MKFIVILIGVLIFLTGISLLINPDLILNLVENNKANQGLYIFGVLSRTVIGILLLLKANESKHSTIVSLMGYLSLFAALVLVVSLTYFGQEEIQGMLSALINDYRSYTPILGGLSVGIGGFLIYAFLKK